MPINLAGAEEGVKQPPILGSGRRKGRPRKLLLPPCCSVVPPAKATELIHRTRKARTHNAITNYFSPRRPDAGAVLEAAECPPLAGPACTPPDQGARRRRSCLALAEDGCDEPLGTSSSGPPEEAVLEAAAAGAPRTPVSPHKIQSLDCQPLPMRLESRPRRPPLSPALILNKPKQARKAASAKAGRSKRPSGGGPAGGAALPAAAADGNHKLTDYFPIRRSNRRTKRALEEERSCQIRRRLANDCDEGLEVALFPGKGRGVVTTRPFARGEFVVEYAGTLVDLEEARRRERVYAQDQNTGCYMYYFNCKDHNWCIDGTPETARLGRLVNHSRHANNCVTRSIEVDGRPRLVLLARNDIAKGEEILYDYGDRSKESLEHHPWLAS
ncbi:N-lysine methyltransferase KMT5A-like isoform X2 [Pollicipes pollicipes]|nr:N-lysine methyltransferase KMT5A-like isoform X2 [Pollicipes pollicipes]XP_037078485.1 N-lysine methyltransferase KMT5A-like isoform X2 [Pollicipes pollicipes]